MKKKNTKKIDPLYRHPNLVISPCEFGHGVFATKSIPADTTLEECPYLRIRADECAGTLDDYVFNLETKADNGDSDIYSLVLGWGSLFNHADDHNTEYWHDTDRDLIIFHTIKAVAAGQQLFVNYGEEWWGSRELMPE
ncbi:SET domain-containing protein-lysine N-methyltransferase [Desulfosarcina variabilis]|uniref:SET domain-containing protein-lysine N-methyltransferase n=1 Tax=Desulfosarcina variabilis TaxID=2300 RepID=UPI003AFA33E6